MDAHALLTSQGWRGSGHSLHPTSDQSGLLRPLLVSRKQNNLGVGKKQHKTSDMWWMNAFDKSLKGLETTQEGKVVQTLTSGGLDMAVKGGSKFVSNGGLYASFVRGESLSGTITPEDAEEVQPATKRRRAEDEDKRKEERRARKEARRAARAHSLLVTEPIAPTLTVEPAHINGEEEEKIIEEVETKEQRRERRIQKKLMRQAEIDGRGRAISSVKKKKRRKEQSG